MAIAVGLPMSVADRFQRVDAMWHDRLIYHTSEAKKWNLDLVIHLSYRFEVFNTVPCLVHVVLRLFKRG